RMQSIPIIDQTKTIITDNKNNYTYDYNYGYDYITASTQKFPNIQITITGTTVNKQVQTTCTITSNSYSLAGSTIMVSRGIIIIGTQFSGYDTITIAFVTTPYPTLTREAGSARIINSKSNAFIEKIALPSTDIDVPDFISSQLAPLILTTTNTTSINIGNYYSQAIIAGQSYAGTLQGNNPYSYTITTTFPPPYPILIIIGPLQA
ncbi:MAG: hypothetical protein ACP5IZ_11330, partial [Thermoprotei archaeon]